jgi:hypothetical protein
MAIAVPHTWSGAEVNEGHDCIDRGTKKMHPTGGDDFISPELSSSLWLRVVIERSLPFPELSGNEFREQFFQLSRQPDLQFGLVLFGKGYETNSQQRGIRTCRPAEFPKKEMLPGT